MTKTTAPPTWRDDYKWGFRVTDDGRIEPLTKREAGVHKSTDVFARSGPLEGLRFAPDRQPFKSNWVRNLSAIVSIMSHRSASCGPSVMITTFQESSWGATEMAGPSAIRKCLPSPA